MNRRTARLESRRIENEAARENSTMVEQTEGAQKGTLKRSVRGTLEVPITGLSKIYF